MAKDNEKVKKLKEKLLYDIPNQWDERDNKFQKKVQQFTVEYKEALNEGKTEREYIRWTVELLEKNGFKRYEDMAELKPGDRVYRVLRQKGLLAAVIGKKDPAEGFNIVGSHVDSPRLDLKPNALYEDKDLVYLKTHYYGGIKKYHWIGTQLSLHGVVYLKNGKRVDLNIGEKEDDPVFTITDLLPHLGRKQMAKKASEVVAGEQLNILFGGIPYPDKETEGRFKLGILNLLNKEYGIVERDLHTAEIEIVPAHKAKDVGLDRAFIGAYGQDDRVCAYTSTRALIDSKDSEYTNLIMLFDKEEIGSDGNTGAQSQSYRYALHDLHQRIIGREPAMCELHRNLENTHLLSSDVTAAFDPTFADVSDPKNSAYAGSGIGVNKYTGSGGKYSTSDAGSEFFNHITRLFDANDIPWQAAEMGGVDEGGGGTIAKYFANLGIEVIDCGVALFSMHSCFEIASTMDIYNTYRAYLAFLEKNKRPMFGTK